MLKNQTRWQTVDPDETAHFKSHLDLQCLIAKSAGVVGWLVD